MRTMKRARTIITPAITSDLSEADEPLTYWKQILPEGTIVTPDGNRLTFDKAYFADCIEAFKAGAPQQVAFQLATPLNGHGRDMDPEKQRALATDMRMAEDGESPGLYTKLKFFGKKAARTIRQNPNLGVSARLRENTVGHDGNLIKRSVVHILGTLDPVVRGMDPWRAVDLSTETGDVLDLSNSEYEGATVAKAKNGSGTDVLDRPLTVDEIKAAIEALSDDELAELSADVEDDTDEDADDELDADDEDESDDDDDEDEDADTGEDDTDTGAAASAADKGTDNNLSASARRAIDLARAETREANRKADKALRQAASAEWDKTRAEYLSNGVPPAALDLAMPILNRPEEFVVDLSNEDGKNSELNVAVIVRSLLDEMEGTIDMSREAGHGGDSDDTDETESLLAQWENESPLKMHG